MRRFNVWGLMAILLLSSVSTAITQRFNTFEGLEGSAQLEDNRIIRGQVSYELRKDVVHIRSNDKLYSFEASQINSFIIRNDETLRVFESLEVVTKSGYTRKQFFELLFKADASLYTRLILPDRSYYKALWLHDFYLTSPDSKFPIDLAERNFKKFKNAFKDYEEEVNSYRKRFDIDIRNPLHVAKVVEYYNSLIQSPASSQ